VSSHVSTGSSIPLPHVTGGASELDCSCEDEALAGREDTPALEAGGAAEERALRDEDSGPDEDIWLLPEAMSDDTGCVDEAVPANPPVDDAEDDAEEVPPALTHAARTDRLNAAQHNT